MRLIDFKMWKFIKRRFKKKHVYKTRVRFGSCSYMLLSTRLYHIVVISKIRHLCFPVSKNIAYHRPMERPSESERYLEGRSLIRHASWNDAIAVDVKVSGGVVNSTHDLLCSRSLARVL